MEDDAVSEPSSSSAAAVKVKNKPTIVRVKRKANQSPLQAFWLEICERPLKRRPLLDFQKLSIQDDFSSRVEEVKSKKVFVQHVETVISSEFSSDALQPYIHNKLVDGRESKQKIDERKHNFRTENKQQKLLAKAKQKQEALSKDARFEQIWRSRKGKSEVHEDDVLYKTCHVYDVVRVDVGETIKEPEVQKDVELEDHMIMASYLPLLREFIPSAAAEVESDIHACVSKRASKDGYVYDLYTVNDAVNRIEEDASNPFPLVQVNEDDEFYDGPSDSEYESDDSNAEGNLGNDYPDEEISDESSTTESESEEGDTESGSVKSSSESENVRRHNLLRDVDPIYDGDYLYDGDDYYHSDGEGDNDFDRDEYEI